MGKIDRRSGLLILSRRELEQMDYKELADYQKRIMQCADRSPALEAAAIYAQMLFPAKMILAAEPFMNQRHSAPRDHAGYIYLVEGRDCFKIGKSKTPPSRMRSFGLKLPFKTRLIHSIPTSDMVWSESYIHKKFAHCWINGEWFDLSSADVAWICSLRTIEPQA